MQALFQPHPDSNRDTTLGVEQGPAHFPLMLAGVLFILNAYLVKWLLPKGDAVGSISSVCGTILLSAPILWTSVKYILRGKTSINELVSLAILASLATGDYTTAGIVAFFMLMGEMIESHSAAGARASIESLIKMTPSKARRLANGVEEEVASKDLAVNDVIRVRPGDNIPADGVILSGMGSVNQSTITGESLPADKKTGDTVFAGTINLTGGLEIKVTRAGSDTTLGRVRELILAAEQTRLPITRLIDQYMVYYTPLVLTLGALVWLFTKDLNRVISTLVISCPCAFILATPSAMVAALSAAARLGVLIKNVADLETASHLTSFIFDKTGTLTSGKLAVTRLHPIGVDPATLLLNAASAEQHSNHPAARALVSLAGETGVNLLNAVEFSESAGQGIRAKVQNDILLAGRASWLLENHVPDDFQKTVDLDETEGFSLIFIARNGVCIGWIGLRDEIRPEAAAALRELRQAGARHIAMVTGDRRPVAERVAKEIGCEEIAADCLPQDKVKFVTEMKSRGYCVAVIGDGVNDAPALASGDVGIAMGAAGSEVALHSATIGLMNSDLRRLPFLLKLSRQTRKIINQNFLVGIGFIAGGLVLASLGLLTPIIAAIMHNVGSLLVLFNSARLVRAGEDLEDRQAQEP